MKQRGGRKRKPPFAAPCPPLCGVRGQKRGNGRQGLLEGQVAAMCVPEGRIEKEKVSKSKNKAMRNSFYTPHFPGFCPFYCIAG